jgi:thiamine-monophosphate kinase
VKLRDLGELGLLGELESRGLVSEIENDAAELEDQLVVTADLLAEGVHFTFDRVGWRDLGFRAAAVNLSDLAASGAAPEALVVAVALPPETDLDDVLAFYTGIGEAGVPVVGGDTSAGDRVTVAVTALGRSPRVPGRGGATAGDLVVVTGPLGVAGAAFRRGELARPPIRIDEGRELAAHAHALLDISDGLAVDAGHIARRSGCRVVVELDRVPRAPDATVDDLGFGEDYELLAAVAEPGSFAVIGRCDDGEGVELLLDGQPYDLPGWEHFR